MNQTRHQSQPIGTSHDTARRDIAARIAKRDLGRQHGQHKAEQPRGDPDPRRDHTFGYGLMSALFVLRIQTIPVFSETAPNEARVSDRNALRRRIPDPVLRLVL
jgi:hypothetical protein